MQQQAILLALQAAGASNSLAGAVTQGAGSPSAAISLRFIAQGVVAQSRATPSSVLREDFILTAVAIAQAPAVVSAAARERFLASVATSQAAAAPTSALAERFIASASASQATASPSASMAERFASSVESVQAAAAPSALLTAGSIAPSFAAAVTQAASAVNAALAGGSEELQVRSGRRLRLAVNEPPKRAIYQIAAATGQRAASVVARIDQFDDIGMVLALAA